MESLQPDAKSWRSDIRRCRRRRWSQPIGALLLVLLVASLSAGPASGAAAVNTSAYDRVVLADNPVGYWGMAHPSHGEEPDLTGNGRTGYYTGVTTTTQLPNRDGAAEFDGVNDYFQIADAAAFSISTTGRFSVELWMRPAVLQFPNDERSGYVHFIGKGLKSGDDGDREWAGRMYSKVNDEDRPNRISGYAWNPYGSLGAGAYYQQPVSTSRFLHYVLTFDTTEGEYGKVRLYINGTLSQATDLVYRPGTPDEIIVVPEDRGAPVRVGTRDGDSWFAGAIAKLAIYDTELSPATVARHYDAMMP